MIKIAKKEHRQGTFGFPFSPFLTPYCTDGTTSRSLWGGFVVIKISESEGVYADN